MTRNIVLAWLLFSALGLSQACATAPEGPLVLYLVRHAEKMPGGADPALSPAGVKRSERLASGLAELDIEAIWSSDFRRTRETASPLARRLDMEPGIYDPRSQEEFAPRLLAAGRSALVVGHSNTIPELATLLCDCEVAPMDEAEYERLIVITADARGVHLQEFGQENFFQAALRR